MKITSKRELIIERTRRVTIHFGASSIERFCRACSCDKRFVTVDEAAVAHQTTSRRIFDLVEAGAIHSTETAEGLLLVCLASLASAINNDQLNTNYETGEKNNDTNNL